MAFVECSAEGVTSRGLLVRHPAGALLPRAVLEGLQPGRIFVDSSSDPRVAFVTNRFGFSALFGEGGSDFDDELALALRRDAALGPRYLLWYAPPERWMKRLSPLVGNGIRRRTRIRFEFDRSRASYLAGGDACPEGFTLAPLTEANLGATRSLELHIESKFWPSAGAFLEGGFGVGLFHGGEVASVCYAACVVDGQAEVDVATAKAFGGRGLGSIAARAFVRECERRGLTPAWDAFGDNERSVRLAASLGFRARTSYDFYSFVTPLEGDLAAP